MKELKCLYSTAPNERLAHKVRTYKEYHIICPSSELGLPPTPHPQISVPPPPCFCGEGNTRWRERGWESPNSDEGHTLWYSLYVRTLWTSIYSIEGPFSSLPFRRFLFFMMTYCRSLQYTFFFTLNIKILYNLVNVRCTGKSSAARFVHLFFSDG